MLGNYKKLFELLTQQERQRFFILTLLMVVVAFAEVIGISLVLVLLQIFSKPEIIQKNDYLSFAYRFFGFQSDFAFQIFLCLAAFLIFLAAQFVKAGGAYAIIRYSTMRGFAISMRLLEAYLHQPYTWFLERNSADISKSVLSEVMQLVGSFIIPSLKLLSNLIMTLFIVVFLLVLDPIVALTAAFVIGGGYGATYLILSDKLTELGKRNLQANKERFRLLQEAIGGVKIVKLMGLEKDYTRRFSGPAKRLAQTNATAQVLKTTPKYVLEALTFAVLLATIMLVLIRNDGNLTEALPILGTFVFAVMRLLPTLQNVYNNLANIRNGTPRLVHIYDDFMEAQANTRLRPALNGQDEILGLQNELRFDRARYSYPSTDRSAISGLDMAIRANTTIGIVGGTGAGKTTVIDLVLGLLVLDDGKMTVDGTVIDRSNVRAWRKSLGYVPQSIYLTDNSISENIAFGVEPNSIDHEAVYRAARTAALHDFVIEELPEGYDTVVGERGVRLSGGQRQRIGIARALYHDPQLLIMDEATSALDNLTERAVMEAVHNIGGQKTIIMIAHRLSTVRNCDQIYLLERGVVAAQGTYDELVANNEMFREMAANG